MGLCDRLLVGHSVRLIGVEKGCPDRVDGSFARQSKDVSR